MSNKRFNPAKLEKLNNPNRLKLLPPEFIIEKSGIQNPKVIIDLGAGTGLFSASFAKAFVDCKIYATDISEVMIDWMKENRVQDYPNIVPLLMEDGGITMENDSADFLCMINLHHELDNPMETLTECYRLLKQGGKIAISDWEKEEMEMGPNVSIRVDSKEIQKQLIECGFKSVEVYSDLLYNYLVVAEK